MMKRKRMFSCIVLFLMFNSLLIFAADYPDYVRGDVNGDGSVTIVDALFTAQYYVHILWDIDVWAADTNCDGEIRIMDALLIAQFYIGVIDTFPCPVTPPGNDYAPGIIIVGFYDEVSFKEADQLITSYNLEWHPLSSVLNAGAVEVPPGDEQKWINILSAKPIVKYAELNYLATIDL